MMNHSINLLEKLMKPWFFELFFLTGMALSGWGAPSVSSVEGVLSEGNVITIRGSGFGTKGNSRLDNAAAPILWDKTSEQYFGGTNQNAYGTIADGAAVSGAVWSTDNIYYYTTRTHRHPFVTAHYGGPGDGGSVTFGPTPLYNVAAPVPEAQNKYYISFYRKLAIPAGSVTSSTKILRVDVPSNNCGGIMYLAHLGYANPGIGTAWIDAGNETNWVRWEIYVDEGRHWFDVWKNGNYHLGSNSSVNGTVEYRPSADWRFRSGLDGWAFNTACNSNHELLVPGQFGYHDSLLTSAGQFVEISEIYYDNTLARVELSNASAWSDNPATSEDHNEIQGRLIYWTDGEIRLILHQGSFSAGVGAFVYVLNEGGEKNAVGFPVTIGGAPASPPVPPRGLRAN